MKKVDQSVYPTHTVYQDCGLDGNSGPHLTETIQHGITLRQHYAGLAIQGLANESGRYHSPEDMAHDAVKIADALLSELERQNETTN